jgi:MFS transporter, DHA2 family, methylenomycin A resistance protein
MAGDECATATLVAREDSTPSRALVLLALCLGVLIAQIDTSVVNLAVQPIGAAFHASTGALQWMLDAYNLVYAVLLLSGGLIADLHGRRLAFLLGAFVVTAASLAAAAAPDMAALIAARAAAGVGAALLLPASLAILRVVWQDEVGRGRALGIWAGCNGLAFAIGPSLGGLLITRFGWPSVFLLVVPLGAAALVLAALFVPESSDPANRRFDAPGQILGAILLGGLAFAAIAGGPGGAGPIPRLAALSAALLAAALFLRVERRAGAASLVPLDLFRQAPFRGAIAATAAMTFGIYAMIFLLPLLWQATHRLSAFGAGLALMPISLVFFFVSTRSGHLAERAGRRALSAGGTALIGAGLLILAATRAGAPVPLAECGLVLAGLGMGLNTGPLLAVAVSAVAAPRAGTAASLFNVARMSGAVLGVAVPGTIFAALGGGAPGFRAAMLAAGLVPLAGALIAAASIPAARASPPS